MGEAPVYDGALASTLGYYNPFRYRGYVYDEETGLYYLRSRYYNPEWGRFVNADALMDSGTALLNHNLFVYCNNNPACYSDPSGQKFSQCCLYGEGSGQKDKHAMTEKEAIAFLALPENQHLAYLLSAGNAEKVVRGTISSYSPSRELNENELNAVKAYMQAMFKTGWSYEIEPCILTSNPAYNVFALMRKMQEGERKYAEVYLKVGEAKHMSLSYFAEAISFCIGSQQCSDFVSLIGSAMGFSQFSGQPDYYYTTEVLDAFINWK